MMTSFVCVIPDSADSARVMPGSAANVARSVGTKFDRVGSFKMEVFLYLLAVLLCHFEHCLEIPHPIYQCLLDPVAPYVSPERFQ